MIQMRLKKVFFDIDMRKSPETTYAELKKKKELPALRKGDGILLINKARTMMQFVFPPVEFDTFNHVERAVSVNISASQRFKIKGSTWSPYMLANYASEVGIDLVGHKRFEWHFKEYADAA